ncbi:MAG: nucleoside triphosphate pyrophosphohydrolase, partial [Patescibacteria group bacterium]
NKLVRDRIPEIIRRNGGRPVTHVARNNAEYSKKLMEKLLEEIKEFERDPNIEELADILEVLEAIIDFKRFDRAKVKKVKREKAKKNGRFKGRIILDES